MNSKFSEFGFSRFRKDSLDLILNLILSSPHEQMMAKESSRVGTSGKLNRSDSCKMTFDTTTGILEALVIL